MMVTAVRITSFTKYWTTSLWMKKKTGLNSRARQTPIIVSTEQIKVPNKNLITRACVGLALTEIKAFFFTAHLSPPTAQGFLWSWLCQSCGSEWAELCKPKARTLKNSLRRTRTWLPLPHSFLHQEFTEVWPCISFSFFFTGAFSCSPGNNKAVHYLSQWALNGEAADWASELSKCSGQLHTHSFILKHCIKHMNKVSVTDLWTQRSSFSWE